MPKKYKHLKRDSKGRVKRVEHSNSPLPKASFTDLFEQPMALLVGIVLFFALVGAIAKAILTLLVAAVLFILPGFVVTYLPTFKGTIDKIADLKDRDFIKLYAIVYGICGIVWCATSFNRIKGKWTDGWFGGGDTDVAMVAFDLALQTIFWPFSIAIAIPWD